MVQENGGSEASDAMSLEQTNALRASMGLEPLAADTSVSEAAAASAEIKAEKERRTAADKEQAKMRKKVNKAAKKKAQGASISELYKSESGSSAADWVKRSRKIGNDKALAAYRQAALEEQDAQDQEEYNSQNLKGIRVAHDSEQFEAGSGVILTLKDTSILNQDGDLNDGDAVLENVNMVDTERDQKNAKIRGQKKLYDALDEEDQDQLLPQYNDEKEKKGMVLTGEEDEKAIRAAAIRAKLKRPAAADNYADDDFRRGKTSYDLDFEKNVVPSDFLPATFKKKKMRKKKDGSKRKMRQASVVENDDLNTAKADDPLAHIKMPDVASHMEDHASRNNSKRDAAAAERAAKAQALKDQGYLKALQKAEQESRKVLEELENVFEEEDDAELQASMARARRLNQTRREERAAKKAKKRAREDMDDDEEEQEEEEEENAVKFAKQVASLGAAEDAQTEAVVFTATTEFCRGLQQTMAEDKDNKAQKKLEDAAKQEKKAKKDKKKEDKKAKQKSGVLEDDEDRDSDDMEDDSSDDDSDVSRGGDLGADDDDDFVTFGADEPRADAGIFQALELAKKRGLLKDKIAQAGRAKDGISTADVVEPDAPGISLQYLDEFGRPMKPKEAFRQLSHTFHGRGPGPIKLEKRLKAFREQQKKQQMAAGMRASTLEKLQRKQKKSGQAFLVLDQKAMSEARPKK
eukprot:CAMPEP_0175144164 /NCGR_PEP_ID=MMETSP0087-20121206/13951_1 /TAXON_ID=136419 /ORGANISM="Unknown Unknown, Strain D1" /LENGTH=691 /DNA_ID=CAMNT_0016428545 /DNA_START=12 /DNA_END=2087 /DNA_ORIENTATION=-